MTIFTVLCGAFGLMAGCFCALLLLPEEESVPEIRTNLPRAWLFQIASITKSADSLRSKL